MVGFLHKRPCTVQFNWDLNLSRDFIASIQRLAGQVSGSDPIGKTHLNEVFLATLGICYSSFFTISKRYKDPNWATTISEISTVRRHKGRKLSEPDTGAYVSNGYRVREDTGAQLCFMFFVSTIHHHTERLWVLVNFKDDLTFHFKPMGYVKGWHVTFIVWNLVSSHHQQQKKQRTSNTH